VIGDIDALIFDLADKKVLSSLVDESFTSVSIFNGLVSLFKIPGEFASGLDSKLASNNGLFVVL
jgi:hypothetical protein